MIDQETIDRYRYMQRHGCWGEEEVAEFNALAHRIAADRMEQLERDKSPPTLEQFKRLGMMRFRSTFSVHVEHSEEFTTYSGVDFIRIDTVEKLRAMKVLIDSKVEGVV